MRKNVWKTGIVILLILCLLAAALWIWKRDSRNLYTGATLVRRWEPCLEQMYCM